MCAKITRAWWGMERNVCIHTWASSTLGSIVTSLLTPEAHGRSSGYPYVAVPILPAAGVSVVVHEADVELRYILSGVH